jgi:hypothetical protein
MSQILLRDSIPLVEAIHRASVIKSMKSKRGGAHRKWSAIDGLITEFMAEVLPDEGLDLILGQFPKADLRITVLSLCLFRSQTSTTVITGGQAVGAITETTYTSYARQALGQGSWGVQGASAPSTDGRKTTYGAQISFPPCGATGDTVNGLFIGWDGGTGSTGVPTRCVGQANFDDLSAVTLVMNDVLKVTPAIQLNH